MKRKQQQQQGVGFDADDRDALVAAWEAVPADDREAAGARTPVAAHELRVVSVLDRLVGRYVDRGGDRVGALVADDREALVQAAVAARMGAWGHVAKMLGRLGF